MFLVIDPLIVSDLLEWGWHHSEDVNPDSFPMMTQSAKADLRLAGDHRIAYMMRYSVISIMTGSWWLGIDFQRLASRKIFLRLVLSPQF